MSDKITGRSSYLVLSWALYDLANQFFALNIISLYFPRWLILEKGSPEIFYSIAFGISMCMVAILSPVLGVVADNRGWRRRFLVVFTLISVVFTMALGLSANLAWALLFFAIANFGCQQAVLFYNALLRNVAPEGKLGLVSGVGRMFGYTGAIAAIFLTKPIILKMGYQPTFIITGGLFLIFSLPCMIFIKDQQGGSSDFPQIKDSIDLLQIFKRLKATLFDLDRLSGFRNLLKASFFGLCAVNTIILFMAVYAGKVFALKEPQIINLIAFSTCFAIIGSLISGCISDRIGYRKSLLGVFFLWTLLFVGGAILDRPFHWVLGAVAGLTLGATWVISRALVVNVVPREKIGEAFGLFNVVVYASAVVGPLFWGLMLLVFSDLGKAGYRLAFFSMSLFVVSGIFFLLKINQGARSG